MLIKTVMSFPGLGIGEFSVDNVAIKIGDFEIYWYGLIITLGIVFAFLYAAYRGKNEKVLFDDLVDVGIFTVLLGVTGARLYYVLTSLDQYIPEPFDIGTFLKNIFNLREGGLAIYGGVIGGALAIIIVTAYKKINTLKLLDMVSPGVMIGQLMGRWGNFFNGEAFGEQVSQGDFLYFMRMGLISKNSIADFKTGEMVYVHPTFLYESLWNLCGFIGITLLYKKKKFNGQIACMYLAWYGIGRFFIEGLRTDSLYIPGTEFRISQVVGMVCFVVFGALLVAGLIYSSKIDQKGTGLSMVDMLLKPDIEMHPVLFKKKVAPEAVQASDAADDVAEDEEIADDESNENGEDDGTDN